MNRKAGISRWIVAAVWLFLLSGCTNVNPNELQLLTQTKGMANEAVALYQERTAESRSFEPKLMEAIAEELISRRLTDAAAAGGNAVLYTLNTSWFSCRERGAGWVCTDAAVFEQRFPVPSIIIPASPAIITRTLLILVTLESTYASEFELLVSVQ